MIEVSRVRIHGPNLCGDLYLILKTIGKIYYSTVSDSCEWSLHDVMIDTEISQTLVNVQLWNYDTCSQIGECFVNRWDLVRNSF
jgi:hypothetical protein